MSVIEAVVTPNFWVQKSVFFKALKLVATAKDIPFAKFARDETPKLFHFMSLAVAPKLIADALQVER